LKRQAARPEVVHPASSRARAQRVAAQAV